MVIETIELSIGHRTLQALVHFSNLFFLLCTDIFVSFFHFRKLRSEDPVPEVARVHQVHVGCGENDESDLECVFFWRANK